MQDGRTPYLVGQVESRDAQRPDAAEHGEDAEAQMVPRGHREEVVLALRVAGVVALPREMDGERGLVGVGGPAWQALPTGTDGLWAVLRDGNAQTQIWGEGRAAAAGVTHQRSGLAGHTWQVEPVLCSDTSAGFRTGGVPVGEGTPETLPPSDSELSKDLLGLVSSLGVPPALAIQTHIKLPIRASTQPALEASC